MNAPSVLFICTANVCRSPMAEGLFIARLKQSVSNWEQWLVDSAGVWTTGGQAVSSHAAEAMEKRGIDIRAHRSKEVSKALLSLFNLVLVMEPGHKEALRVEFPDRARRIWLLTEMSGPPLAVDDPYGATLQEYENCAAEMDELIKKGWEKIILLADE